jgi:DNA polymerase V
MRYCNLQNRRSILHVGRDRKVDRTVKPDNDVTERPEIFRFVPRIDLRIPLFADPISAGFPSPAEDHVEESLDFNERLVRHPEATFCVTVRGRSMTDAGIFDGDILVIDKAITPRNGHIVAAWVDGEFTVKRLGENGIGETVLFPEHPEFKPLPIRHGMEFFVWGVVTYIIHNALILQRK